MEMHKFEKALEIGCGIGKTTHLIAERYNKLKITAIDYENEQINIAKKNKIKNVGFLQGDATNIKFKNSSFDYAIEANIFSFGHYTYFFLLKHILLKKNS